MIVPLRVAIIGAGLGGLTLAQGLRKRGVSVEVYERDRTRSDRLQGYRIHISPGGSRALYECLRAEVYTSFLLTVGKPNRCLSFFDEQLHTLLTLDGQEVGLDATDAIDSYKSVTRTAFREVLMAGLEDVLHFDKHYAAYQATRGGTVTLLFEDGTRADCDVLVGADGTQSRVRRQLLPGSDLRDTGGRVIAGKAGLTPETRSLVPWQFFHGGAMILARGSLSGFAAVHEFPGSVGVRGASETDYVMWNVLGTDSSLGTPEQLHELSTPDLRARALEVTRRWGAGFRELIVQTDLSTITPLTIRTSVRPDPWQEDQVTVLGDAIHAMPPTAGVGAVCAITDAAVLTRQLMLVSRGDRVCGAALRDYQTEMLDRAFQQVNRSNRNLRQALDSSAVKLAIGKNVLRLIDMLPPARHTMTRRINH